MEKKTFLAERLTSARKGAGLTPDQAGEAVGKSGKTIQAYEAAINLPSVPTLMDLCRVYGVDIPYFFPPVNHATQNDDVLRLVSLFDKSSNYGKELILEYARMVSNEHPKK